MTVKRVLIIGFNVPELVEVERKLLAFDNELVITQSIDTHLVSELVNSFNLIVLDTTGIDVDLFDVIKCIKQSKENSDAPIVLSLNQTEDQLILRALAEGIHDVIIKPYKKEEFFARVSSGLLYSSVLVNNNQKSVQEIYKRTEANDLLQKLVPDEIFNQFSNYANSKTIKYASASILFADMVDFTKKAMRLDAHCLIQELTEVFSGFDDIMKQHNCFRLKTMGDGYMAVSGIPSPNKDHAINIVAAAADMRSYIAQRNISNSIKWEVRIGINTGEVIGSVLGKFNFLFDVFGDAVNIAARVEKSCAPNQINVALPTYMLVRHKFEFIERLPNQIKGVGVRRMFYLKRPVRSVKQTKQKNAFVNTKILLTIN